MSNPLQQMAGQAVQSVMGNNPLFQLVNMMRSGGNPQQLFKQFIQQNPQMNQALPFVQGKNPQQLQQTFYNMCKERGVDPNQVAQSIGITLPK